MTDWLRYIASYPDLIAAFGADPAAGERHYNQFGRAEGRSLTRFDPLLYGASNPDVARAYGADEGALERHYIQFGFRENRATASFDALRYGASNPDLIKVFGADIDALARHYISSGLAEGRSTTSFDPLLYAASNPDLARAFGTNAALLVQHFYQYGVRENRPTNAFDATGYLLANADLAGLGVDGALRHWIAYGVNEGRLANPFGTDQVNHDAAVGRVTAGTFEGTGDRDWYDVTVTAGQKVSLAVLRPDLIGAVVTGAGVEAFDAGGHSLGKATMSTDGFDHWLSFTAASAGIVHFAVSGNGASGAYQLGVAQVGPDHVAGSPYPAAGFIGGALADVFLGGNGSSIIQGNAGDDILGGGPGQDDFIGGPGADFMDGGKLIGADNTLADSVSYEFSPTGVTAFLDGRVGIGGYAQGDRLLDIEVLRGSPFADTLYAAASGTQAHGGAGNDVIYGGSGDDQYLSGGDGDDKIYANGGNDVLSGGAGSDLLDGGDGYDTADYQLSETGVRVDLRSGVTAGGAAGDRLVSIETVIGSYNGADILATNAGAVRQTLLGYGGDDILLDRSDADSGSFLVGNAGNDLLVGTRIRGDEGDDILVSFREHVVNQADGQAGADTYVVEASRHGSGVFDFSLTIPSFDRSDRIDLSQLRDEGGRVLDMADIVAHAHDNIIDLTGFRTAAGASVVGYIELNQQAGLFDPITPFATSQLQADDFVFAGGTAWKDMVPADFPIF